MGKFKELDIEIQQLEMDEVDNAEWDEFVLTLAREQGIVDFLTEVEEAQNG
jgi:hypothetical protein